MQITKIIQKKIPLTAKELNELLERMEAARDVMQKSKEELDSLKEAHKDLCEQQNAIIDECFEVHKRKYTTQNINCTVVYEGSVATYYSAETGEKVEGIPLEEGEQLEMTGGKVRDAEELIRNSEDE